MAASMDKDVLTDAKEEFAEASEAWEDNRAAYLDDVKFARLAEQWPAEVEKQREKERRPCLTINRLPAFIRQVVNDGRQNKPAIKVHPVDDSADVQTAEILNGLIRNIEYSSSADVAYDTALECAVTGGFGFFRIGIDYAHNDTFDLDINIKAVPNPLSIIGDPRGRLHDSSDWNVAFVSELIKRAEFKSKYPGATAGSWEADGDELDSAWISGDDIRVAEYWKRDEVTKTILRLSNGEIIDAEHYNRPEVKILFDQLRVTVQGDRPMKSWKVTQRIITCSDVLETNDWAGIYIPIIPVYGDEVNVEGVRHFRSLVRDAKDPQRMFNYWRTASTELVALAPKAPWVGPKGFAKSDPRWATANTETHQFLEFDGNIPPTRQPFAGVPAGALQEALNASDDMKAIMGIYDASLGARSNETSGRAILARQREGDVGTFHFIDNLSRGIRHAGRVIIDLIPKVYNSPRVVRILGEDKIPQTVRVNEPFQGPDGLPQIHDLTVGKYDLTVSVGPSFTTKREEAANQMTELVRAFPQVTPLIGDLIAKNLDWPGADEIAKRMQTMLPQPLKGPDPAVQQLQAALQQMQQKLAQAEQDKSLEARKLDISAFDAETKRLQAVNSGLAPEQVQALVIQTLQQLLASPDILPGPVQPGAAIITK